jgi:hypothetical protein
VNNTTAQEPIAVDLPAPQRSKSEREYETFLRLLPALLETHRGKYVAIHDGEVVDSGDNDIELIQRVHQRIGYVPIHVGLVMAEQPVFRVPHYREHRQRDGR